MSPISNTNETLSPSMNTNCFNGATHGTIGNSLNASIIHVH